MDLVFDLSVVCCSVRLYGRDHGSLKTPVRSTSFWARFPFRCRRIAKIGLLYNLLPLASSSMYFVVCLFVLITSFSGNHFVEYLGFFSVFSANLFMFFSLLVSSLSRPDSLVIAHTFFHNHKWLLVPSSVRVPVGWFDIYLTCYGTVICIQSPEEIFSSRCLSWLLL